MEHDMTLTKPSGLTGDTRPWPVKSWHWTLAEIEAHFNKHHFPPCTWSDVERGHLQGVIAALTRGEEVPECVLAEYPEAQQEAEQNRRSEAAWDRAISETRAYVERFRASAGYESFCRLALQAINAELERGRPIVDSTSPNRPYVHITVDGIEYWAEHLYIAPEYSRHFGKVRSELSEWAVRRGRHPRSLAWEPLARIPAPRPDSWRPITAE